MININWKKFFTDHMWFGYYWAPNGGRYEPFSTTGQLNWPEEDSPEVPGWARSIWLCDQVIPMKKL